VLKDDTAVRRLDAREVLATLPVEEEEEA